MLKNVFAMREMNFTKFRPEEIEVVSNRPAWSGPLDRMEQTFQFRPHFGWTGAIGCESPKMIR